MASMNITILGGNMARDPEIRFLPSGMVVADFGLAVNRKWKSDAGELKEEVSFFDCVAFGRTAEVIGDFFKKGSPIICEGRLKQETWLDKQTEKQRSKVKVIVEKFHFCGDTKKKPGGSESEDAPRPSGRSMRAPATSPPPADEEQDIPF